MDQILDGWNINSSSGQFNCNLYRTGAIRHALTASVNITVSIGGNLTINGTSALLAIRETGTCAITVGGDVSISAGHS